MSLNAYLTHAALARSRQQARKTPQEGAGAPQATEQGQPLTKAENAPQRPAKAPRKAKQ